MARKGWDQLTPKYRQRLERAGLTPQTYAAGAPLHKARGKTSAAHESALKKQARLDREWAVEYADTYGLDIRDVRVELARLTPAQRKTLIAEQRAAEAAYDRGGEERATSIYRRRSRPVALKAYVRNGQGYTDWMFYYHGAFH